MQFLNFIAVSTLVFFSGCTHYVTVTRAHEEANRLASEEELQQYTVELQKHIYRV
jgi:hypothetical protein